MKEQRSQSPDNSLADKPPGSSLRSGEDRDLAIRAREGDLVAFEALVRKYHSRIYRLSYRLVGNGEDAQDISQEVFIRLHKFINKHNPHRSLLSWLFKVATNLSIDFRRSRQRRHYFRQKYASRSDNEHSSSSLTKSADQILVNKELNEIVNSLLNYLTEKERAVFTLRDLEDFSSEEVVEILGCASGTVRCHLHKARTKIRDKLSHLYPDLVPFKENKNDEM
ncbi:MAG: sigma-70 family RNA polymerase sigma factor [Nitrospirae bacterium]|nr:sigma-70 family RNA polymerase sigma factor [Nitrospirota bacterium]